MPSAVFDTIPLDRHWRDICILRRATDIPAASNNFIIPWDGEVLDTDNMFDPGAPTLITCPVAGIYWIMANICWAPTTITFHHLFIEDSAGNSKFESEHNVPAPSFGQLHASGSLVVDAGTSFRVRGTTNLGGAGTMDIKAENGVNACTRFAVALIQRLTT